MDKLIESLDNVVEEINTVSETFPENSLSRKLMCFIERNIQRSKKLCKRIIRIQERAKAEISEESESE